jgi:hypothetical protein
VTTSYATLRDKVITKLLGTGRFQAVNGHQPLSQPVGPASASVWAGPIDVVPRRSGLDTVKYRLQLFVSVYVPLQDPLDVVEVMVVDTSLAILDLVVTDFQLDGAVDHVDLLGTYGEPVGSSLGYLRIDQHDYRTATITIPLILADTDDSDETP